MVKKFLNKVKIVCGRFKQAVLAAVNALVIAYITAPIPVFASSYTSPLIKLKTVFISILGAAGVLVLLYGIVKFAESFQKKDQNGEYSAIYTVVAGGILLGASAIIDAIA